MRNLALTACHPFSVSLQYTQTAVSALSPCTPAGNDFINSAHVQFLNLSSRTLFQSDWGQHLLRWGGFCGHMYQANILPEVTADTSSPCRRLPACHQQFWLHKSVLKSNLRFFIFLNNLIKKLFCCLFFKSLFVGKNLFQDKKEF